MSLQLASASSQYAQKAGYSGPSGYVVAMGCMFKATAAATQGILQIGNTTGQNRMVIRNNVGQGVNVTEVSGSGANVADQAASNTHTLNAWNWANAFFLSLTSRGVYLGGTRTNNATNVVAFPTFLDEFLVGCTDAGGVGNFFNGKVAHVWVANAWNNAWDALLRAGRDPRAVIPSANLLHYWPLATSYVDVVGGTTLAGVNAPTFSADQPTLTRNVSPWALGYPLGRPAGVRPYDSRRYRTRGR